MTQLRLMSLVLRIIEDSNHAQYADFCKMVQDYGRSLDFKDGQEDFTNKEIEILVPHGTEVNRMTADSKIRMIKARRERTNESLTDVVKAAQKLYAANGWNW